MNERPPSDMLKPMRRGLYSLLVMLALSAGVRPALLTGSQQGQRNQAVPLTPDSNPAMLALARQNIPPPPNAEQPPPSSVAEELSNRTVVLDPAHGGADFGARGPTGLAESDVVLDFARAARIALEAQRLRVLLTREGNQDPSFDDRSAMVNGLHNALFISLHVSSSGPVGTARTYYYLFPRESGSASESAMASAATPWRRLIVTRCTTRRRTAARAGLVEWDHAQQGSLIRAVNLRLLFKPNSCTDLRALRRCPSPLPCVSYAPSPRRR